MLHVGLRCANPTYRVPVGSGAAKFFDPFFVHSRLARSRMRFPAGSCFGPHGISRRESEILPNITCLP